MTGKRDQAVAELDHVLEGIERAKEASPYDDLSGGLARDELRAITTRLLAAIDRYAPQGSSYRSEAERAGRGDGPRLLAIGGVLAGLRDDIADGYLTTIEQLIHAEVFADFLEMADELQGKGYKDPAAVMAGSVLEEHLRNLADAAQLSVEDTDGRSLRADRINSDLARAGVYGKLDQKSVTAWLDLRNKAAHGRHETYDPQQVALLIQGVRDFISRTSA